MNTFEEYLEEMSRQHPVIRHEDKGKCHFSSLADNSQTKFALKMNYPCVVVDSGDFSFTGGTGNVLINTEFSVMFLDHVKDTGNNKEITAVFNNMKRVLLDFVRKFSRDKRALKYKFLNRFTLIGSEGHRIYLQDSGLYGYVLFFNADDSFNDANCDNVFND
ncbi:hypothetical protein [Bacteroides salyersiae]|uniref:hypothetical protein n=1 Tax=Bacteroides salyersiae TaxID=291644 RepID=UPI00189A4E99|nr:hypothetical protein [Bacteroides salyersiae]